MDGVIVVDKPAGWTSHDVVGKLRRLAHERSIGHLGTLDPLATGVLPLVAGRATRLARFFTTNGKRYDAWIQFGITTSSYDRDGIVLTSTPSPNITREQVENELMAFRGTFPQMPPPVSAKKVNGVPAYKLARKNLPVELKPAEVTVFSLEMPEFQEERARLVIHCAGGTYVRSIVHDLGQKLGCGAVLDSLRRLSSGGFTLEQSHTIEQLQTLSSEGRISEALIPAAQLLPELPSEHVDPITTTQIRQGRDFRVSPFRVRSDARFIKALDAAGDLVAIGEAKLPNLYHPILVF